MFKRGSTPFATWLRESVATRLPGGPSAWEGHKTGLQRVPTDWFLTGLATENSSRDRFYLNAYTYPLFYPAPKQLVLSFSRRLIGRSSQVFPLPSASTADEVADAVAEAWEERDATVFLDRMGSAEGLLDYIEQYRHNAPVAAERARKLLALHAAGCYLILGDQLEAEAELNNVCELRGLGSRKDVELAHELQVLLRQGGGAVLDRLAHVRDASLAAQLADL